MTHEEELELLAAYQPEMWLMRKDNIYAAQSALKIGIKYIQDTIDLIQDKNFNISNHVREEFIKIVKNEKLLCEQALEGLVKPE